MKNTLRAKYLVFAMTKKHIYALIICICMLWFNSSKYTSNVRTNISVLEYDTLCKRVSMVESKLNSLEIENTILRNKVLRKIQIQNVEPDNTMPNSSFNSPSTVKGVKVFSPFM